MFHADTKWIWLNQAEKPDEYASFQSIFFSQGGKVTLKIASEINYIAYVNGKRAAFGQFPGYPDEKYYDELDITEFVVCGENELRVVGRYEGIDTLCHIADKAGVIFEVTEGDNVLCRSNYQTMGGLDTDYQQHVCRLVTWQLGYSSDMCKGDEIVYENCREVDLSYHLKKRPVKKMVEESLVYGKRLDIPGKEIYDFGREVAGHLVLTINCEKESEIVAAYGEHLLLCETEDWHPGLFHAF